MAMCNIKGKGSETDTEDTYRVFYRPLREVTSGQSGDRAQEKQLLIQLIHIFHSIEGYEKATM